MPGIPNVTSMVSNVYRPSMKEQINNQKVAQEVCREEEEDY